MPQDLTRTSRLLIRYDLWLSWWRLEYTCLMATSSPSVARPIPARRLQWRRNYKYKYILYFWLTTKNYSEYISLITPSDHLFLLLCRIRLFEYVLVDRWLNSLVSICWSWLCEIRIFDHVPISIFDPNRELIVAGWWRDWMIEKARS